MPKNSDDSGPDVTRQDYVQDSHSTGTGTGTGHSALRNLKCEETN